MKNAAYKANARKLMILTGLMLLAVVIFMTIDVNFSTPKFFWFSMKIRTPKLLAMLVAAFAIGAAMVIAQDTEYVLLDEPTNNLDIYHATNMMKNVRRLCDELGKTVILVLHEINYAAFYSDYICAFLDGKIAKFGTVEEVITKETLSQVYKVDFEIMNIGGKPLTIYY